MWLFFTTTDRNIVLKLFVGWRKQISNGWDWGFPDHLFVVVIGIILIGYHKRWHEPTSTVYFITIAIFNGYAIQRIFLNLFANEIHSCTDQLETSNSPGRHKHLTRDWCHGSGEFDRWGFLGSGEFEFFVLVSWGICARHYYIEQPLYHIEPVVQMKQIQSKNLQQVTRRTSSPAWNLWKPFTYCSSEENSFRDERWYSFRKADKDTARYSLCSAGENCVSRADWTFKMYNRQFIQFPRIPVEWERSQMTKSLYTIERASTNKTGRHICLKTEA